MNYIYHFQISTNTDHMNSTFFELEAKRKLINFLKKRKLLKFFLYLTIRIVKKLTLYNLIKKNISFRIKYKLKYKLKKYHKVFLILKYIKSLLEKMDADEENFNINLIFNLFIKKFFIFYLKQILNRKKMVSYILDEINKNPPLLSKLKNLINNKTNIDVNLISIKDDLFFSSTNISELLPQASGIYKNLKRNILNYKI